MARHLTLDDLYSGGYPGDFSSGGGYSSSDVIGWTGDPPINNFQFGDPPYWTTPTWAIPEWVYNPTVTVPNTDHINPAVSPEIIRIVVENQFPTITQAEEEKEKMSNAKPVRRLVQVLVYDPDVRVLDENAQLYKSEEFLTIKTDDELKMELDFKTMLEKHNEHRKKVVDEDKSEGHDRVVHLRPVKISDLEVHVLLVDLGN